MFIVCHANEKNAFRLRFTLRFFFSDYLSTCFLDFLLVRLGAGQGLRGGRPRRGRGRRGRRGRDGGGVVVVENHVPDEGVYGRLPHQAGEEELLHDGGGDPPQGGEPHQEATETGRLRRVVRAAVVLQGALGLLLQLLYHRGV